MKKLLLTILVLLTTPTFAALDPTLPLIDLPETASVKFNTDYLITSMISRSGSPLQSLITLVDADLKSKTHEAARSRERHGALIEKLKPLKNFAELERIYCFIDFNAELDQDVLITTGDKFAFKTPDEYGSPTSKTQQGARITLDTQHDSTLSASFEDKRLRRLYCSFKAGPKFGWGTDFVSDMTVGQFKALLAPYLELN